MLYELSQYLAQYHSGFNVFQYLTLRSILGVLTALSISLIVGPPLIRYLNSYNIGQRVRDDGPESHFSKAGTPTMGGTLILVAIVVSTLLWSDLSSRFVWIVLFVTIGFGVIGWIDDYKKIVYGNSRGLSARNKYIWQSVIGLTAALALFHTARFPIETQLIVPFIKNILIDLGWMYVVLTYFVIVGSSNAVNLTDGLVIEFCRRRIGMTGGRLHILQAGPVIERGGNECGAHGVCGVATLETGLLGVLA